MSTTTNITMSSIINKVSVKCEDCGNVKGSKECECKALAKLREHQENCEKNHCKKCRRGKYCDCADNRCPYCSVKMREASR